MDFIQTPSYKIVRDGIVNDILSGVYGEGGLLSGQEYYARKFGVCRTTVRKAIEDLVKRKVLYTIKGKGTFVCDVQVTRQRSDRTLSFSVVDRVKVKDLTSRVDGIDTLPADGHVSRQLQIDVGDQVVRIKRLRMVNGIPENYQISYLSKALVAEIDFETENLVAGSLFRLLEEKADLIPNYSEEEIRAVRCTAEVANALGMECDDPVIFIMRTTYEQNNRPMEYCEDYECTDVKGLKLKNYAKGYHK